VIFGSSAPLSEKRGDGGEFIALSTIFLLIPVHPGWGIKIYLSSELFIRYVLLFFLKLGGVNMIFRENIFLLLIISSYFLSEV
jgi:hypothetical protein